ncbi:MAG: sialidase family protein [Victivallaceae bacterium]|nr:sialidase family protein [Victivallaceae bacterium]
MKKQLLLCGLAAAAMAAFASEKVPFGSLFLDGGRVEPRSMTMVESSNEHLNFCFANQFPDGSIYLDHSAGIHTVTEHGCNDLSTDGGKTWSRNRSGFGAFNSFVTRDGKKRNVTAWIDKPAKEHFITVKTVEDGKVKAEKSRIVMPYESTFRLHREVIRTRSGKLLLTGYVLKKGDPKFTSILIGSDDDGRNWNFISDILSDPQKMYREGPNEAAVIELANGELLAYVRPSGQGPLLQLRSKDGGVNWSKPESIAPFCVAPAARILKNGALVVVTGRPGLYLLIDFSGSGKHYQNVCLYDGSGSSYASILEVAPNELLVLYDESDFGSWRNAGLLSRIMAMRIGIVRDDKMRRSKKHAAEASRWKHLFSAENKISPLTERFSTAFGYQPKDSAKCESYFEFQEIAEYPHPVMHFGNKGVGTKTPGSQFSHFAIFFARGQLPGNFSFGAELRLTDPAEKRCQFGFRIALPAASGKGSNFGWIGIAVDRIEYRDNGELKSYKIDLGTKFHKFEATTGNGKYTIVCDGKKIAEAKLAYNKDIGPGFTFGDGATAVYGEADLAWVGWTDDAK